MHSAWLMLRPRYYLILSFYFILLLKLDRTLVVDARVADAHPVTIYRLISYCCRLDRTLLVGCIARS
jgi:hypothetical protein